MRSPILLHKRPFLQKHYSFIEVREHTGSSITKLIFQSASQKRSQLRDSPQPKMTPLNSPKPVLTIPSHNQMFPANTERTLELTYPYRQMQIFR